MKFSRIKQKRIIIQKYAELSITIKDSQSLHPAEGIKEEARGTLCIGFLEQ